MNLRVAVLAAAIQDPRIRRPAAADVGFGEQVVGMPAIGMALLAQDRPCRRQQHIVIGAVGLVTVQAVVAYRGMLPDEGSSLLGVTLIANLIDAVRCEQWRRHRPVRRMAVDARHFALDQRHVRAFAKLVELYTMASCAGHANAVTTKEPRHR